jgi:UDPglucose 6-dehydrogenase
MKIGICGLGMVGGAVARVFPDAILYDPPKGIGSIEELNKADVVFICVPTPYTKDGCDTSLVEESLKILRESKIVVIKSTVIPGTTNRLQANYPQHKILFNPEFLTEETADQDMKYPERQIIGFTDKSYNVVRDIMKILPLATEEHIVPSYVAEFAKYACNSWFATKVAKNNELYDIFTAYTGDDKEFEKVIDCISTDRRIGRSHLKIYHKGSRGFGGKCLPKDLNAFIHFANGLGVKTPISTSTKEYNDKLSPKK